MISKYFFIIALVFFSIASCNAEVPKLESAFGIKFGADIEDVRKEIEKNGEVFDSGFMFNTNDVPDPNPYFSSYVIFADFISNEKVELISADSEEIIDDQVGLNLFNKIETELIKKYGEPIKIWNTTELYQYSKKSEDIDLFKQTKWNVGIDEIELSFQKLKDQDAKYISIGYHSKNTYESVKKNIDSKGL